MAHCESCGRDDETVTKVQRMYLAEATGPPGTGAERAANDTTDEPRAIRADDGPLAGDIELWCASCCATFPHVTLEAE